MLLKGNTPLNTDVVTIWEIDVVTITLWVKAYPVAIVCPHVELHA